jgi:hypothetical protein
MLATKEALRIASRQAEPPWKLKDLMTSFGLRRLSLRSLVTGVQDQRVAYWVNLVDDLPNQAQLTDVNSFVEQVANAPSPQRKTLVKLSTALAGIGGSLVLSKTSWKTVGIAGTYGSLTPIKTVVLDDVVVMDVARGAALVAGGEFLIVAGTATFNPVLILGGEVLVGGGLMAIGVGAWVTIGEIVDKLEQPDRPKPTSQEGDSPSDDVLDFPPDNVGTPPDDLAEAVASGDWSDTGPIQQFIIDGANNVPGEPPVSPGEGDGGGEGGGTGLPIGTGEG